MANVIITLKIMPASPESDIEAIVQKASEIITAAGGNVGKVDKEPFAFGLTAIKIMFVADEASGSSDETEKKISEIEEVNSVEAVDVRRAVG
ncbi:MAG: elongation factor 1-beta [bacterium]|nr:elongation factor 1-beta [bacterium]